MIRTGRPLLLLRLIISTIVILLAGIISLVSVTLLFDMSGVIADVAVYFRYADKTFSGAMPYRDFTIEYPIFALPFFLLPRLFATTELAYAGVFVLEMLAVNACLMWSVFRAVESRDGAEQAGRALNWYVLCVSALAPMALGRFDLVPAWLAFLATLAIARHQPVRSGTLAAIGFLLKLFPVLVLAPGLATRGAQNDPGLRRTVVSAVTTAALGLFLWFSIGGRGVLASFHYHAARGLEIESIYSGLLMAAGLLLGSPLQYAFRFGSIELVNGPVAGIAAVVPFLQMFALLAVALFVRRHPGDIFRSVAALFLAFILFGKVISPQYVLWLLPLGACWLKGGASRQRWLLFGIAFLTSIIHPWIWFALLRFEWWAVLVLNLRNALLLVLLLSLLKASLPFEGRHEQDA